MGHQCPDCVAEGRRSQRPVRTVFGGTMAGAKGYVTMTLIALNIAAMVVSVASAGGAGLFGGRFGGLLGQSTPLLTEGMVAGQATYMASDGRQLLGPYAVAQGEFYRLVTAMFLHYGLLHLLVNMYALWVLGRTLEGVLGPVRFLTLYLVAGFGGNVAVYLFTPAHGAVGASTAIFGLFAALFVILKRLGRDVTSIIPLLVLNILISFAPGISLAGHIGGLVVGAVVALALAYAPRAHRNLVVSLVVAGVLAILVLLVAVQTVALDHYVPIG